MFKFARFAIATSLAFTSALVFAQTNNGPVTREQVRAELIQLEAVGYQVGDGDSTNYPEPILQAEARLAAKQRAQAGAPAASAANKTESAGTSGNAPASVQSH